MCKASYIRRTIVDWYHLIVAQSIWLSDEKKQLVIFAFMEIDAGFKVAIWKHYNIFLR